MYIVIKKEDVQKYLSSDEIHDLVNILETISNGRMQDNKHTDNAYYVCNTDESYANAAHTVVIGMTVLKNSSSYCPGALCAECFHD